MGEVARRRHQPPRYYRFLSRRAKRVGVSRPQQEPQSGPSVLRLPRGSGGAESALAKEPGRARAGDQRRGAWPLRRSGSGHPCRAGGNVEECTAKRGKDLRDQNLPWRAARLSRRLPCKLSQGGCGGCLEPGDCLVQEIRCADLTTAYFGQFESFAISLRSS